MDIYGQKVYSGTLATGAEASFKVSVQHPNNYLVFQVGTTIATDMPCWLANVTPQGTSFPSPTQVAFLDDFIYSGYRNVSHILTGCPQTFEGYIKNEDVVTQTVEAYIIPFAQ